mmetsp:Transcript_8425/g.9795  ORF Transcript_8425/g.9795 Transcript_8425/m.9795 type:complete len:212 (-) Transcript_8425:183-818(-)
MVTRRTSAQWIGNRLVVLCLVSLVSVAAQEEASDTICEEHFKLPTLHTEGSKYAGVIKAAITAFPSDIVCSDGAQYSLTTYEDVDDPGHKLYLVSGGGDEAGKVDDFLDCDAKADENIDVIGLNCLGVNDAVWEHEHNGAGDHPHGDTKCEDKAQSCCTKDQTPLVVGLIIGTFLGGALMGALVCWCIMKRRLKGSNFQNFDKTVTAEASL